MINRGVFACFLIYSKMCKLLYMVEAEIFLLVQVMSPSYIDLNNLQCSSPIFNDNSLHFG